MSIYVSHLNLIEIMQSIQRKRIKTFIFLVIIFLSFTAKSQQLSNSRRSSYLTYIYKLEAKEAIELHSLNTYWLPDEYLHNQIDSFPTDSIYKGILPIGHYLFLKAQNSNLIIELKSINSIKVKVFNNNRDLNLFVYSEVDNKPIADAVVKLKNKTIQYQPKTETYNLKKTNKEGLLIIEANDETAFYQISRGNNNPAIKRIGRRIYYFSHIGYLIFTFKNVYSTIIYRSDYYGRAYKQPKYKGYLAFNKPKYLPLDTLKWKAFITKKNGKPYKKDIRVVIYSDYEENENDKGIVLSPESKGAYMQEMPLSDSLTLNKSYTVKLKKVKSKKTLISNRFYLEDYQLDESTYKIRADDKKYHFKEAVNLFLTGKDINGLNLLDSRITLNVYSNSINDFIEDKVFVADKLWTKKLSLDPIGETIISIPDSIFPKANMNLKIEAIFNNSNNETHTETIFYKYSRIDKWIECHVQNDSLFANYIYKGVGKPVSGRLIGLTEKDTIINEKISFPYKEKLNAYVNKYQFVQDETMEFLNMVGESSQFNCLAYRISDSLFFTFINPLKLPVRYIIFKGGNKIIEQGTSVDLNKIIVDKSDDSYFISCHFVWAGNSVDDKYSIHAFDKNLNIEIEQPDKIYPGQKVDVTVRVTDYDKEAVPNVNITAGAINSQFESDNIPELPYLGKNRKNRPYINSFTIFNNEFNSQKQITKKWSDKMALDSILYYKLIFPENGIFYHYDSSSQISNAQFSPYLFYKGFQMPIFIIYVDYQIAYYYDTDNPDIYSLIVDSGYHSVRLRTRNKEYFIDSLYFKNGTKLDLSIDTENVPEWIIVDEMPTELTFTEVETVRSNIIYVKNNFRRETAYLWQGNNIVQFNPYWDSKYSYKLGPFKYDTIHFGIKDKFKTDFVFEPNYEYIIEDGLIKLLWNKNYIKQHDFPYYLGEKQIGQIKYPFNINLRTIEPDWAKYLLKTQAFKTEKDNGTLQFEYEGDSLFSCIRLSKNDTSVVDRFYRGNVREFFDLSPGLYQLLLITDGGIFMFKDSICIKPNGINYYRLNDKKLQTIDSLSEFNDFRRKNMNSSYFSFSESFKMKDGGIIKGIIKDKETDETLPFANVVLLNNGNLIGGTVTDLDGQYVLHAPIGMYDIQVSYVGYEKSKVINVNVRKGKRTNFNVELVPIYNSLSTFEIVCYKMPLTYNETLACHSDRVSYSYIKSLPGVVPSLSFRGARTSGDFIYIDGVKVKGSQNISAAGLAQVSTITGSIPARYGDINSGIINLSSSIRSNFSDCAYWQPNLITNDKGEAHFQVQFPDNVTKWKTYALAMDGKKHSGVGFSETKAYKPLLGQLATPRFLLEGDQADVIGKISNYTSNSESVSSSFKINNKIVSTLDTIVENSVIEKFSISATNIDTLNLQYQIKRKDGYLDGEERKIPVYQIGMKETKGTFHVLDKDTIIEIPFEKSNSNIEVYAVNDALELMLDEIEQLKDYPYGCMEQTASKLIACLLEKNINSLTGQKFHSERKIKQMIRILEAGQNDDGGWGWWPNSKTNVWMTAYVLKALNKAELNGYDVNEAYKATQYLFWHLDIINGNELLFVLKTLSGIEIKLPYENYIRKIEKDSLSYYQKLMIMKIKQDNNIKYSITELLNEAKQTYFGNYYWSGENYGWYENSNNITLLAYQIIEKYDSTHSYLPKIRNYFLEIKGQNKWQNTIDKAQILETILPAFMGEYDGQQNPATIKLSGAKNEVVNQFPYKTTLPIGSGSLSIQKSGRGIVYLTTYQSSWNPNPELNDSLFEVKTWFEKDGERLDFITAGEPVELKVQLTAKKKGNYVMIEVPIPAGCSYGDNNYNTNYVEVHREYFKNKTSIFCEQISAGVYTFSIKLQPRFSGNYTLNPSKAELMYFPVFYGNNQIRKTVIE